MTERKPRHPLTFDVLFGDETDGHVSAAVLNISESGVLLEFADAQKAGQRIGQRVTMTPLLPRVEAFNELTGAVARVAKSGTPFHLGVQFVDVSSEEVSRLRKYFEAHSSGAK
jgi:PilZ domain